MGKRYVIEKALNNNILQIRDGETEKLFIGRGIGFGKKPGELFEKNSVVDKVFVIEDDKNQNNFKQIFRGDGPEFVDFCEELILLIARSFHEELHETIHISLIDHISCTLRRLKLGEQIVNPFLSEIEALYDQEFQTAGEVCRRIEERYDVSMPLTAQGCFSVLTLKQTPGELMEKVKQVCQESFEAVIQRLNASYAIFRERTGQPQEPLPWKAKTVTFGELYQEALASGGKDFEAAFAQEQQRVREDLEQGKTYMIEANFRLIDRIYDFIEDVSPRIVYGLMPPYYPNVSNCYFQGIAPEARDMSQRLNAYTQARYGQAYDREYFYTGICDLSYINSDDPAAQRKSVSQSMPLFGWYYDIPFEDIQAISMAGINIGPWGKDFHKLTERVFMPDLYDRTPHILDHAISLLLE